MLRIFHVAYTFYQVIGTVDSSYIDDGKNIRLSSDFSGELLPDENSKNSQKDSFFEKKIKAYREWVLKNRKNLLVPLPQNELLPSVYTLKFKRKTASYTCIIGQIKHRFCFGRKSL